MKTAFSIQNTMGIFYRPRDTTTRLIVNYMKEFFSACDQLCLKKSDHILENEVFSSKNVPIIGINVEFLGIASVFRHGQRHHKVISSVLRTGQILEHQSWQSELRQRVCQWEWRSSDW